LPPPLIKFTLTNPYHPHHLLPRSLIVHETGKAAKEWKRRQAQHKGGKGTACRVDKVIPKGDTTGR